MWMNTRKSALIFANAKPIYDYKMTNDGNSKLAMRCCDFRLLEEKCGEYEA